LQHENNYSQKHIGQSSCSRERGWCAVHKWCLMMTYFGSYEAYKAQSGQVSLQFTRRT